MVTTAWHASKYKVHELHQRYILSHLLVSKPAMMLLLQMQKIYIKKHNFFFFKETNLLLILIFLGLFQRCYDASVTNTKDL